ncbi:MAG: phenol hydroxylase [Burkholderiaceae bacterium]|nr:phenol hydroxylase [Burkholderiaceae bacterium]
METNIFDTNRKFVRLIEVRGNGMVEFEFAIGEPELFVELMLPRAAFQDFCRDNQVTMLAGAAPAGDTQWDWRLRQARDGVASDK